MIMTILGIAAILIIGIILGKALTSNRNKTLSKELYYTQKLLYEHTKAKHETVSRHLVTIAALEGRSDNLQIRNRLLIDRLDAHKARNAELEQKCKDKQARIDKLSAAHSDRCSCGRYKKISEPICVVCKAKAGVE